jgi:hypothetical protein
MALQHRTQRSGEQLPEHLLRRRGVRRGLSLPARHVGQNLRGEADEVEESLGEIGRSVGLRDLESRTGCALAPLSDRRATYRARMTIGAAATQPTTPQIADLRDEIEGLVEEFLDGAPDCPEPAELEYVGASLLALLDQPPLAELAAALPKAAERRGDPPAAGLLEALAALARQPLAGQAAAALDRLRARGVDSPLAGRVGRLQLSQARIIEDEIADRLLLVLERPREREAQLVTLVVEREETGGALVDGLLTPPASRREVRSVLRKALRGLQDRQLARDDLAERLLTATARAAELELVLPRDVGIALPLIARALGHDPGAFPQLAFEPPSGPLDIDPDDEEGLEDLLDVLLEEFDEYVRAAHGEDGPVFRAGHYVAGSMLHWKHGCGDGRLGHWTRADVEEYLLDHYPRKLSADDDLIACTPECVAAFIGFLDERDLLTGDPPAELESACRRLGPRFDRAAHDRRRWGPGKAIATQMLAEGVDLADERAVAAWMDEFNARPRTERDRVLPSLTHAQPAEGARRRDGRDRRTKRKATRAARRRNRR